MGSAWAQVLQLYVVREQIARSTAITGTGVELVFYQRKRLWSDFNSAGAGRIQRMRSTRGGKRLVRESRDVGPLH